MGANVTKSGTDVVNNSIISVMLESAQNCSQYVDSTQSINTGGFSLLSSYSQSANISLTCLQNLNINTQLLNDMANKIVADTKQTNTPLLPTVNYGDVTTNIKNILQTKISQKFVQDCVASLKNVQTQNISGVQIGTATKQNVDLVMSCISKALNNAGVAQSIVAANTQTQSQVSKNPLQFIADIVSTFSNTFVFIILGIVGLILYFLMGDTI